VRGERGDAKQPASSAVAVKTPISTAMLAAIGQPRRRMIGASRQIGCNKARMTP